MAQHSDAELVEKARNGDNNAYAELVRRYQNAIYEMACRMLGDRDAGFDAAQEVFIKAHRALDRYDPKRKFSTWILSIARNHCIDQIRRPARRLSSQLDEEGRVPDEHTDNPRQVLEKAETSRILEQAVEELPDSYREAVQLYHYQDLSYAEAAEIQGVPLGTFMARLHRARAKLRDKLRPLLGADNDGASKRGSHQRAS